MADVDQHAPIGNTIADPSENTKSHVETLGLDHGSLRFGGTIRTSLSCRQVVLSNGDSESLSSDGTFRIHFQSSIVCLGRTDEIPSSIGLWRFRFSSNMIVVGSECAERMHIVLIGSTCLGSKVRSLLPFLLADQVMRDLSSQQRIFVVAGVGFTE
jgi:hypothetical protein